MNVTMTLNKPLQTADNPGNRVAIAALELLGGARAVVIEHQGERYELRLTRNGKLILTK